MPDLATLHDAREKPNLRVRFLALVNDLTVSAWCSAEDALYRLDLPQRYARPLWRLHCRSELWLSRAVWPDEKFAIRNGVMVSLSE